MVQALTERFGQSGSPTLPAIAPPAVDLEGAKARQILDGAEAVFAREGYSGASMNAIAAAAAVSKGTLYNHFADKESLFAAFVHDTVAREGWPAFQLDHAPADVADELRRLGERFLRLTTGPRPLAIFRVVVAEAERFPELGRVFMEMGPMRASGRVAEALAAWHRQGLVDIPDPAHAAWQFLMLCRAEAFMERLLGQRQSLDEAKARRDVDRAVALFVRGYAVAPR